MVTAAVDNTVAREDGVDDDADGDEQRVGGDAVTPLLLLPLLMMMTPLQVTYHSLCYLNNY